MEFPSSVSDVQSVPFLVHIIRHGQSLHNIDRDYPHRDPPLTEAGQSAAKLIKLSTIPDLIVVSFMTRTIQTALIALDPLIRTSPFKVPVQVWPDLREAHDAICNKGVSRVEMTAKFPEFDFLDCPEEWNYPPHIVQGATDRAETVRKRLRELSTTYKNIVLIIHRGFIAFLVQGKRFDVCETRSFRFASDEELPIHRYSMNCDTAEQQDFGPTLLLPCQDDKASINAI